MYWRDWSSDVCSSDLHRVDVHAGVDFEPVGVERFLERLGPGEGAHVHAVGREVIEPAVDDPSDQIGRASCRESVEDGDVDPGDKKATGGRGRDMCESK